MARSGIVLYHGIRNGSELRDYARLAEDSGFGSLWVTERYFHEETFSLLGYLAAATERIRLGVGVANPYTRNPALLAMAGATLDRISGGRFILGLGRSDRSVVEGRMGISYGDPRAALGESVTAIRGLLAGERITSRGHFRLTGAHLEVAPLQSQVPVYLGAIGPMALRLAGTVADGVLLNAYTSTAYVRYAVEQVRQAATGAGRDPDSIDIACMLVVRPTDDPEAIWPDLKRRIVRLLAEPHVGEVLLEKSGFDVSVLGPLRRLEDEGGAEAARLITDEMVDAFYLVGPTEGIRRRIGEYRDAGVGLPLLLPRLEDFRATAQLADA